MQARVLRFRFLNLVACLILIVFNAVLGIWPMVAMNVVLSAINVWFLVKLLRDRHDEAAFEVLEVGPTTRTCSTCCACTERHPASSSPTSTRPRPPHAGRTAFLVQKGDETLAWWSATEATSLRFDSTT